LLLVLSNKGKSMFFRKKDHGTPDNTDNDVVDIQWGGYYIIKEEGKFRVFRLLDFNKDAYHAQLFQEKFDNPPTFEEVKGLKPFIWHAPIAVASLLDRDGFRLIGQEKLDEQALAGYEEYLRQMGVQDTAAKDMVNRLIEYSSQTPMKVRLTKSADGVTVTPLA
jgi:hypothetical protein